MLRSAVPSTVGALLNWMIETTNMLFIGQYNDPKLIAAVGMGNIIHLMVGIGMAAGLNSALETLVS